MFQLTGTFFTPHLVTKEYSNNDVQRLKSIESRRSEIRDAQSTVGRKSVTKDAQSIDSKKSETRNTQSIVDKKAEMKDVQPIGDRTLEIKDAQADVIKKRTQSDKISDYEVVFDRRPPPPFDKPVSAQYSPLISRGQSAQHPDETASLSNQPPSQNRERSPSTRTAEITAIAPTQSNVSSGQDKLSNLPFNKETEKRPATSPVITEAGSSKGKSNESPQSSSEVEIQSCKKCLQKGRTCISDCPKAKVSKKYKK